MKYSFGRFRPETRLNPRRNYVTRAVAVPEERRGLGDDREFFENMPTIKFFPGTRGREIRVFRGSGRGYPHFGPAPLHRFEHGHGKGKKKKEKKRMDDGRRLLTAGLSRRALKFREIE